MVDLTIRGVSDETVQQFRQLATDWGEKQHQALTRLVSEAMTRRQSPTESPSPTPDQDGTPTLPRDPEPGEEPPADLPPEMHGAWRQRAYQAWLASQGRTSTVSKEITDATPTLTGSVTTPTRRPDGSIRRGIPASIRPETDEDRFNDAREKAAAKLLLDNLS